MDELWILSKALPCLALPPEVHWTSQVQGLPDSAAALAIGLGPWGAVSLPPCRLLLLPGEEMDQIGRAHV